MASINNNKAIGWDIGIKNLAYCVLEQHSSSNISVKPDGIPFNGKIYDINHWKDISLVSQIESNQKSGGEVSFLSQQLTCNQPKTDKLNAPVCSAVASYCNESLSSDGKYQGYCKNHYKKIGSPRMPTVIVSKCYYSAGGICTAKASSVLKNHIYKAYCKKHITEMVKAGIKSDKDFLKINRVKNAAKIDINQLGIALMQELDKIRIHILEPSVILLENQPVLKNPTMKTMQMFLYSYYLMRHLDLYNGLGGKKLQCYTASKKLDLIKFLPVIEQQRIQNILDKVKSGYQKNKKMSILIVEYLLKGNIKWLDFFNKHPKQDDLADSLLMTLHFFERDNLAKLNKASKKQAIKDSEKDSKKKNKPHESQDQELLDDDVD
jgi:hypothetical protein